MSRTLKGSKAPGFEYWTDRPGNRGGQAPGRISKRITHRRERRITDRELHRELREIIGGR